MIKADMQILLPVTDLLQLQTIQKIAERISQELPTPLFV